ncbi:hypothetical protein ABZ816_25320 [Actinosynnema sp. NPDC047251]|uniref:Uncharacterized protein n=1 Tax=Saccharothrix espanaensis (strain ATCC 51144 / DSM 44229 / JCM 9112 / NBRC 15066 / NRRL 15764) TaxID=1179773 RepID=K0K5B1_SACES|nr:hypothetical protein [Saccharothrix espanaensis]CCH31728.1 hypothetical protein BN6_44470 [Saccharothrix espanaensis DSM 44229]
MDQPGLPGDPTTWREFRGALKKLMKRSEVTALAIERMSVDAIARSRGAESTSDATVGRKIADKEQEVDARSVRTIVVACALSVERRGGLPVDADVDAWLRARTRLVEAGIGAGEPVTPAVERRRRWSRARIAWLAVAVAVAVAAVAGGVAVAAGAWRSEPVRQSSCATSPDRVATDGLTMGSPASDTVVTGDSVEAGGTVDLAPGERPPWLLLHAISACKYYLVGPTTVSGRSWTGTLYVDPAQHGVFGAYAVVVGEAEDDRLHQLAAAGRSPFIEQLPDGARVVGVTVRCCA